MRCVEHPASIFEHVTDPQGIGYIYYIWNTSSILGLYGLASLYVACYFLSQVYKMFDD